MSEYKQYNEGAKSDDIHDDESLAKGFASIPAIPQNK